MTSNYLHPDFFEKRDSESQIAYEFRIAPYAQHREGAQDDAEAAHAEFRRAQETRTSGSGYGLAGDMTPLQRAQAVRAAGVQAGEQRISGNGHLARENNYLQPSPARVFASQLQQESELPGSPLLRHLRGEASPGAAGMALHEEWS